MTVSDLVKIIVEEGSLVARADEIVHYYNASTGWVTVCGREQSYSNVIATLKYQCVTCPDCQCYLVMAMNIPSFE
jgi:hypothetical protein